MQSTIQQLEALHKVQKSLHAQLKSNSRSRDKTAIISGFSGNSKITRGSKSIYASLQELPKQKYNAIGIQKLQQKIKKHQGSQESLKNEETKVFRRQIRSRNAPIKQSLSQNTAPVQDQNGPEKQTNNQYQNMLIGDQSLTSNTQSMANLNETLQNLNIYSNTNSNSNVPPVIGKLNNLSVQNKRSIQKRNPYFDQEQQIEQIMNLNKGRNQIRAHQQTAQVQMKNALIGLTDNPSSNGDSSLLTIGLPSVMNAQSCIQLKGSEKSNINVNMNVNFNIQSGEQKEQMKKSDAQIQVKKQEYNTLGGQQYQPQRRLIPQKMKNSNQTTNQQAIQVLLGKKNFRMQQKAGSQSRNKIAYDSAEALRQRVINSRQNSNENEKPQVLEYKESRTETSYSRNIKQKIQGSNQSQNSYNSIKNRRAQQQKLRSEAKQITVPFQQNVIKQIQQQKLRKSELETKKDFTEYFNQNDAYEGSFQSSSQLSHEDLQQTAKGLIPTKDFTLGTGNFPSQVLSISEKFQEFKSQNPYESLKVIERPSQMESTPKTKITEFERPSTHEGIYNEFTFDNTKQVRSSVLQSKSIASRKTFVSQDGTGTDPRGVQSTIISKGITLDPPEFGVDPFERSAIKKSGVNHLPKEVYKNLNVLHFDEENSFDQESSSRYEDDGMRVIESPLERLDVMESQQFDTQYELAPETYQTNQTHSVMRFDCEGTEVELEDRKDDNSDQEIERNYANYAMQPTTESQILFDQRSPRKFIAPDQANRFSAITENSGQEYQLQTAIINPSASESREYSSNPSIKKETPAFNEKHRQMRNMKTMISQDFGITKTVEKEDLYQKIRIKKLDGSRNPRFQNQSISTEKKNDSLEQRLKQEQYYDYEQQKDTIVSKQRVRQVPVQSTPKKLRNISSAKKGSKQSPMMENSNIYRTLPTRKNLSMKQDNVKKNVYHIFGRQTTESDDHVSIQQPSKKQRKLLFVQQQQLENLGPQPQIPLRIHQRQQQHQQHQYSMDYRKIPLETKKQKHQKSMVNKLEMSEINQGVTYDANGRGRVQQIFKTVSPTRDEFSPRRRNKKPKDIYGKLKAEELRMNVNQQEFLMNQARMRKPVIQKQSTRNYERQNFKSLDAPRPGQRDSLIQSPIQRDARQSVVINEWMRSKNGFKPTEKPNATRNRLVADDSQEIICHDNMVISNRVQRGRYRYARGNPKLLMRVTMSEQSFRSLDRPPNEKPKSSLSLWCCLHSKSRAQSCESNGAVKDNNSDNGSGCSVF